jgi:hypothetical protein
MYNKFIPHTSRHQWNSRTASMARAVPVLRMHCICLILNGLLLCFYYYVWWVERCDLIVTVDQVVSIQMHLYFITWESTKKKHLHYNFRMHILKITSFCNVYHQIPTFHPLLINTIQWNTFHASRCVYTLTKTQTHNIIMNIRTHFQQKIPTCSSQTYKMPINKCK